MPRSWLLAAITALLFVATGCARRPAVTATEEGSFRNYLCTAAGGRTALTLVRATMAVPAAGESAYLALDLRNGRDSAASVDGALAALWADSSMVTSGWIAPTAAPLAARAGTYTLQLRRLEFEPYWIAVTLRAGFVDTLRGTWRRIGACGWFDPLPR